MTAILDVLGREILDSRGNPTIEVDVILETGASGRAAVASGASTGIHEAHELRDKDATRYGGKGVQKAVENVNGEIFDLICGLDAEAQAELDGKMCQLDGTQNKSRLGANAILGVSLAVAKAAAMESGLPLFHYVGGIGARLLPLPMMNILNGGEHADNGIDIQEFMVIPKSAKNITQAIRMGAEIFHALKLSLKQKGYNTNVGDEGGFAPNLASSKQALDFIMCAIETAGYKPEKDVVLALDCASSEYFKQGRYHLKGEGLNLDSQGHALYLQELTKSYPIVSIEDGMAEDDWQGWAQLTALMGDSLQLVGDDLFVTNPARIEKGIKENIANAVLIKPNQIGTLTQTIEAVTMAHHAGYKTVMSHRSGETEDTTIADLAVALGCGQIKAGSLSRCDRIAKYNQLLRIEEELGATATFAKSVF